MSQTDAILVSLFLDFGVMAFAGTMLTFVVTGRGPGDREIIPQVQKHRRPSYAAHAGNKSVTLRASAVFGCWIPCTGEADWKPALRLGLQRSELSF
jgi:hypothetical protein